MKQINIKHIASLHTNTLNSLNFYEQEIDILKNRLEEIASKNTGHEVSEGIEYFQNQFIIHSEKIDELKHAFHSNLQALEVQILETTAYAGEETLETNERLFDEYLMEETLLNQLRHEFLRFAAKWM
ncbi:MAG: hypothetical protein JST50_00795 [Bacteroidetes bacterium]|jgi:HPt (histidine-containing phosphotransfer) domain-containing protein|nr:hypothetical protein [Bacteroidota bacterium]